MRTKTGLQAFLCFLFLALIFSCKKHDTLPGLKKDSQAIYPTTPKEKQRVAVLKEVGEILQSVYRKPLARYEVVAAINTGYYEDERVLLKDLLFPESSPLYNTEKFKATKVQQGVFKKYFFDAFNEGNYPNLKEAMGLNVNNNSLRIDVSVPGIDTTNEIWTNEWGTSIYFPYSENFPNIIPHDPDNNTPYGNFVTIVSADREDDSGVGWEPYYWEGDPGSPFRCKDNICYSQVVVDDDYAEAIPTHIVGVGAEPARMMPEPPPPATNVNRVFHGWSALKNQLDHFISFTGNGGGSEIKVARISGYLQFQNQQVTNFAGDIVSVNYKRRDIKHKIWKRVYGVWDADWVPNNLEQVYAVWEEDKEGTSTFTGSLGTTVKIDDNTTITGSVGFNVSVKTQDELVTQRKITRTAYFGAAKADQGCGFGLCDTRGCRFDDTFLPPAQFWPVYDCGSNFKYTWPYNSY